MHGSLLMQKKQHADKAAATLQIVLQVSIWCMLCAALAATLLLFGQA